MNLAMEANVFHSKLRTHLRGELYAVVQLRRCSSKSVVGLLINGQPCCNVVITGPTDTRRGGACKHKSHNGL